jgi:hypothetical protein
MSATTSTNKRKARRAAGKQTRNNKLLSKKGLIAPFFIGNGDQFDDEFNFVMDQWTHTGMSLRAFGRAALINAAVSVSRDVAKLRAELERKRAEQAAKEAEGADSNGAESAGESAPTDAVPVSVSGDEGGADGAHA